MRTVRIYKIGLGALAMTAALGIGYFAVTSGTTLAQAKGQDRQCSICTDAHEMTFSGTFSQSKPADVARWIQKEGIHLKVNYGDLPDNSLTLVFDGVDEKGVVETFGKAVGMQTVSRDGVYSLMRGVGGDSTSEPLGSEDIQDSDKFNSIIGPDGFGPEGLKEYDKQDRKDENDIELEGDEFELELDFNWDQDEFDFEWDEDLELEFGQDFEMFMPDVSAIIEEVMAALEEAGLYKGDQKLSAEQKAKLKARLQERLGKLQGRMGRLDRSIPGMRRGLEIYEGEEGRRFLVPHAELSEKMYLKELEQHMGSDEFKRHIEELKKMRGSGGERMFLRGPDGMELRELMELRGLEEGRLKGLMELRGLEDLNVEEMRGQDGRKLTDAEKKQVKEAMAQARKAMEEAMKGMKSGQYKLHMEEGMKAHEKAMLELEKHMQSGEFRHQMEESTKAREKAMLELKKYMGELGGKMRFKTFDNEAFEKQMQEYFGQNSKFQVQMKELELRLANLQKFMDSLTDDQKALAKKQGHLKWDDLTKKQQSLLGEFGKEGGTFRFNMNDKGVTIKKDKRNKRKGVITA